MAPTSPPVLLVLAALAAGGSPGAARSDLPFGWFAAYEGGGVTVETHAPAAAFALDAGQAIHPRVAPDGPWEAHYLGIVGLQESGRYRFAVEAEGGEAFLWIEEDGGAHLESLETGGAALSEGRWLELGAVDLRVGVRYVRGDGERARLRLLWEMEVADRKGFRREPVLARRVSVPSELTERASAGLRERAGFVLLERKRCAACHPGPPSVAVPPAPDLSRAGERMTGPWIARWMANPGKVRPGADMPALLGKSNKPSRIASYLVGLHDGGPEATGEVAPPGDAAAGEDLYHRVGCVACHGAFAPPAEVLGDPFLPAAVPDVAHVPFGDLAYKWSAAELARFLADPSAVYPDGRMPDHALSEEECADLAAYLTGEWGAGEPVPLDRPDDRSRDLFASSRCHACHSTGEELSPVRLAAPLDQLDPGRGCLDFADAATPRYDLTTDEVGALRAALSVLRSRHDAPAPLERAEHALELQACWSCHARGGLDGVDEELRIYFRSARDEVDLGDEGRLPPDLSGVGFRLTSTWLRETLEGERRARPYVAARMPHFGASLAGLAEDLARLEGVWPDTDAPEPEVTDALVAAGRSVMGRDALGCVACHVYADYPPDGSPGLDMTGFGERLRYEWYRAFIADPSRYEPGTRMPAFGRGGISTLKTLYDADLFAQADALWAYFSLGEGMPPPEGLEPATALQIEVGERPVVLRTFLEDGGSRAIAVGHPNGVHVAFDAQRCLLAAVWRGAFLDAAGAWAGRGGTPAGGLGPALWSAGDAPPPALEGRDVAPRFRGYRLDPAGRPAFEYTLGDVRVRESHETRSAPRPGATLRLVIDGGEGEVLLFAIEGGAVARSAVGGTCSPTEDGTAWRIVPASSSMEVVLEVLP